MSILIRKLIFLPLVLVFISCTVTKRVHRPGYHIQWHKIERTQKTDKEDSKIKESNVSTLQDEINLELAELNKIKSNHIEPVLVSETIKARDLHSLDKKPPIALERAADSPDNIPIQSEVEAIKKSNSAQSIPPIFWRTPPDNLRKLGIALMILGGMIMFASLLVYLGAFSGNGNGAWLNFFLDLIDISGWFWLLFFIIAFILVSYLLFLFVIYVLGGPLAGLILGLVLLSIGIFFFALGKRREVEPPN